jgi:hypothetical protein
MKVDLSLYSEESKKFAVEWYNKEGYKDRESAVAVLATITYAPVIVVTYWLGESLDYPEWLEKKVHSIMTFYKYTEIANKPKGCRW